MQSLDPLFPDAARMIVESQVGSTSPLQRRMKLGYNRAGLSICNPWLWLGPRSIH
ncbi:MAG: DNA translocase FtsK [Chitinophagaceae bacterium]